ncbi:unnamed protein product [Cuscuta campestris]|uniref:NAC domain-containing protein n=1 Tax=Cuscuta campestris TaxID=132261 RepID=A0A484LLK8_9ASTE|nr:unnamed protein product [Cuscuta campestris]
MYVYMVQDSYALCRVFKKNGICYGKIEELQAQQPHAATGSSSSSSSLQVLTRQVTVACYETPSPDIPFTSSSCNDIKDDQDKGGDESWMQFITEDAWSSFTSDSVSQTTPTFTT